MVLFKAYVARMIRLHQVPRPRLLSVLHRYACAKHSTLPSNQLRLVFLMLAFLARRSIRRQRAAHVDAGGAAAALLPSAGDLRAAAGTLHRHVLLLVLLLVLGLLLLAAERVAHLIGRLLLHLLDLLLDCPVRVSHV